MKLLFNKPYKSIWKLELLEMPNFVVLTGVNGAGKSHLLEAIENGSISIEGVPPNQLHGEKPTRRFDGNTLVTQDTVSYSGSQISNEMAGYWDNVRNHWATLSEDFYASLRPLNIPGFERMEPRDIVSLTAERLMEVGLTADVAQNVLQQIGLHSQRIEGGLTGMFVNQDPNNRTSLLQKINAAKKLPLFAMSQNDFYESFPDNWQQIDLFQQSFARPFSAYQKNWRDNELRSLGKAKGAAVKALTNEEFLEKFGKPPWDYLNNVLEIANLDFRVNAPFQWEDRPYEPILVDHKRGVAVKFADLSSGERVIMSFALCLYHVNDPRAAISYPKVLLFDEIDAPLHPSMTSSLLKTIEQTLVQDRQIKVILTTHSPSTVALAPDASIFVMRKTGVNRLEHCSKDAALGILTAGVPTLSVNYENRRQVFVESKYDAEFYGDLFELLKPSLAVDVSMTFISSGVGGNGNCDQVRSIVNQLRVAGSRTVFGLVDWDLCNRPSDGVYVLGMEDRYNIENYLLDPLLIGLLLLREKILEPGVFFLPDRATYLSLSNIEDLSLVSKSIVNSLKGQVDERERSDIEPVNFTYASGLSLWCPRWVSRMHGHKLESVLKTAFPALLRYRNEPDLKRAVLSLVLDDRPSLIPTAFADVFRAIQNSH